MRRYVTPLLVGLLLLQWNAALAHCLMMQRDLLMQRDVLALRLELCSSGGDAADPDDGTQPQVVAGMLYCPVCQSLSAADVPRSTILAVPVFYGESSFPSYVPQASEKVLIRGRFQPRAPPLV